MDAMASLGITTPATQDVVRVTSPGATTEPRGGRTVRAGDLVSFDAGVVADGYAGEVGRTWPADLDEASPAVLDLYRRSDELWDRLLDACRPGAPASALLDAYLAAGEPLPATPVARGIGLGFDDPVIVRDLPETAAAETLDPGVVLVVTGVVSDRRRGVDRHPRGHPHHPRGPGDADVEPLLAPRARRSVVMTEPDPGTGPDDGAADDTEVDETDWILYEKDPATKIATITLNRPDDLNAMTIGMRHRYADLLHQANIDDDVKVLVIRGDGDEPRQRRRPPRAHGGHVRADDGLDCASVRIPEDADVEYPPRRHLPVRRHEHPVLHRPGRGMRSLQDFKKISIVEVQGYCYGWHFYQAGRRRPRHLVRRRPVRPRRVPLRRLRRAHVAVGDR